jgi:flagellar basal body L-ring protein FlgH
MLRTVTGRYPILVGALWLQVLAAGCASTSWLPWSDEKPPPPASQAADADLTNPGRLKSRPPVNTSRNLYEGSLWRGASSWGNLMRDHRARFPGDLLTIAEVNRIVKVPEPPKAQPALAPGQAAPGQQGQAQPQAAQGKEKPMDPVLAFLKEQEERQQKVEAEQNDILRSLETVEVEVIRVLPNGNLVVRGVHPPIFRDRNRVKYIITLRGIVRPSDVDDNNSISSTKLSKAELKIRRLVKRGSLPLGSLARAAGKPKEGALIDRLTDFATSPGANRTTQASPQ